MHRITLGVDASMRCTGLALFRDDTLIDARLARATTIVGQVDAIHRDAPWLFSGVTAAYIEMPQIYPRAKEDANDLITIAVCAGAIAGILRCVSPSCAIRFVRPREWKGNVEADIMCGRIEAALSPDERRFIDAIRPEHLAHNALDAAGLVLHAIGRL